MSRVLPILFNTDMVRAILDGRKTVTRRIVPIDIVNQFDVENDNKTVCAFVEQSTGDSYKPTYPCRYKVNDILYVRETWCWIPCWDCGMDTEEHNCCYEEANKFFNYNKGEYGCYGYKASFEDNEYPSVDTWHPSIHMPKEAARIWLRVTNVRVERLQDITEEQARAEGATGITTEEYGNILSARDDFEYIWNSTISKNEFFKYGWNENPWVWVIEFERCEKPEPCILKGIEPAENKRPCIGYATSDIDDEPEQCKMCKECNMCIGNM